ncbi:MAG: hypothetical protein MUF49_29345 [Oculatellaceae cyanobacterium Prado106]|nr:hypothetical protein [Oculatellaceae cyanobacterium Prado106]
MNLEEFEHQTRDVIEQTLNQLHTATLLIAQLENQISETGRTVQSLSQLIEAFVAQQKDSDDHSPPSIP